jgi:hypothetical protein
MTLTPLDLMLWALALVIAASAIVFTISIVAALIRSLAKKRPKGPFPIPGHTTIFQAPRGDGSERGEK